MLTHEHTIMTLSKNAFADAVRCLEETDPAAKCALVAALDPDPGVPDPGLRAPVRPGRPNKPRLVDPRELPRRQLGSPAGHAAFIHAICHIEFTAINLALDALVRFPGLPRDYYAGWVGVAREKAEHFALLAAHLATLDTAYGDFDAHDGLWDMAERTSDDILRRMALVPRVMEARGLDVTPGMIRRLLAVGDEEGARILERILADEIGHVALGSHWFERICRQRGLDPQSTFADLVAREFGKLRSGAMNTEARLAAGFSARELDLLRADNGAELAAKAAL